MTSDQATPPAVPHGLALGVAILLGSYLLLTSTVTLHETMWKFDVKRVLELCLFPLIFAAVLFSPTLRRAFQEQLEKVPGWVTAVLLVLLMLGLVSSVYNAASGMGLLYSLAEVSLLTLWLVAVLVIAACRQVARTAFDQAAIALITLVGLAVGVQELTGIFAALSIGVKFHPVIALMHFSWPRFYNQVQTWSLPVIAALPFIFPGKPLAKFFCVATLALEWYVVIATGARGAMVGVLGGLAAAWVFLPTIRKALITYQLYGLVLAVVIYGLVIVGHQQMAGDDFRDTVAKAYPITSQQTPDRKQDDGAVTSQALGDSSGSFVEPLAGQRMWTSSGRIDMWREVLHDARNQPLLGVGPMNYACKGPINRAGHPHNFPLQFMDEWGIPAALLLLATLATLLFKLAGNLREPGRDFSTNAPLAGYFATGMLAAMILACLDGVMVMPSSQVTGILVCGCLVGLLPGQSINRPSRQSQSTIRASVVLLLALSISVVFLALARHEIAVADQRWTATPELDRGIPRFWQNGKVCRLYQQQEKPQNQR